MSDDRLRHLDELKVVIPITEEATGLALDLTGLTAADFTARAGLPGAAGTAGTVTITDAAAGLVTVVFQEGALVMPRTTAELRLTRSGETQTVWSQTYAVAPAVL